MHRVRGIFVTGTGTNVGKTVVSAALMLRYRGEAPLRYWKPVQTGIEHDDDSHEVMRLSSIHEQEVLDRGVRLRHPVSPHLAARLAETRITIGSLLEQLGAGRAGDAGGASGAGGVSKVDDDEETRWIVEGAGGVLVPLNERETMADLIG